MDHDGEQRDDELDSEDEEMEDDPREESYRVKTEVTERSIPDLEGSPVPLDTSTPPKPILNGSIKQSISSIIDRTPELEPREALASLPPSESISQGPTPHLEQTVPAKRKYEYSPEKENTKPKEGSTTE